MRRYQDMKKLLDYLSLYKLQNIFPPELLARGEFHDFQKGEKLCTAGEPVQTFYILLTGQVKIFAVSNEGKALSLKLYEAPINLGDIELITETGYRSNVEALSNSLCLAFPISIVREYGLINNEFLRYLCLDLCHKFDDIASVTSAHILYPLKRRLVSYLMQYFERDSSEVVLPISNKELAELLGTTYRHLARTLSELERDGLLEAQGDKIRILKEREMKNLCIEVYPHKSIT